MAERRMFSKQVIDSDLFLEMPLSTQVLYFHLAMRADDDGFVNNSKRIQRMIGASDDDMKILVLKGFIIPFETGIIVIKHWRMQNALRQDRYKPTLYQEEFKRLTLSENGEYTAIEIFGCQDGNQTATNCEPSVAVWLPQDSIGKDSIEKDSTDSTNTQTPSAERPSIDYALVVESFNSICKSLPSVIKITDKRKKAIRTCLALSDNGCFDRIFEIVESSDFLTGREGTWCANFDWVFTYGNMVKIVEGNYNKKVKQNPSFLDFYKEE